ncbi:MAG: acyltransferase [Gammaproteobacteria bacterium]
MTAISTTAHSKNHYTILDGLRGVAALTVVVFHLFEVYALGDPFKQIVNHGYLAVDFFFMLSGFVVAYAYDDRWQAMSQWDFYKRRLIRLQPMVIMGSLIGAALFYFQAGSVFPKIGSVSASTLLLVMFIGCTLVPLTRSLDIRGWSETYPLNAPAWSLFYEYIGNVLYAVGLRKLSNRALAVFVFLAAVLLLSVAVYRGSLAGGWSLDGPNVLLGFSRLLFPFFAGVLLMRLGKRIHAKGAFGLCGVLLIATLAIPRIGGTTHRWENGLYEALCVIFVFPFIIALGAGDMRVEGRAIKLARFFGDVSYPLYITHYPLIYIYTAWAIPKKVPPGPSAAVGVLLLIVSIVIAYACLKLYDEPLRRWLSRQKT